MMKNLITIITLICSSNILFAQHNLSAFDHLVNKTWRTETNWKSERPFFQEVSFEFALDSTIVLTKTKGHINEAQTEIGNRNFGVRQYDKDKKEIYFVEYDVFGGKTEGTVHLEDKDLIYTYTYGGLELTEKWIYLNPTTYTYKIGIWKNDTWEKIFLESQFIQVH